MEIDFCIIADDGDRYYRGDPGIAIEDYRMLAGLGENWSDAFWDMVRRHYQEHDRLSFTAELTPETTVRDLERIIVDRCGFDWEGFLQSPITTGIYAEGQMIFPRDPALTLAVLEKHHILSDRLQVFFILLNQAGDIWVEDGLRYYMHSKEAGRHHVPHVHVDYRREKEVSISLYTAEVLDGGIPAKALRKAKRKVLDNQRFLMECWNRMTDGLQVDIDHYFGIKPLELAGGSGPV